MPDDELLFLSHRIPFPPNKGDKIRAHAIITHLAPHYKIHLACHIDDPHDLKYCSTVQAMLGGECIFLPLSRPAALRRALISAAAGRSLTEGYFDSPVMRRWIGDLLGRRPVKKALVFGSAMAPYILRQPELNAGRCILDLVDVDSDKWSQYAKASAIPKRWLYGFEARKLAQLERRAARAFGTTVLVSPHEAATFTAMAPESASKIYSICNGVDLSYFDPAQQHRSPYPEGEVPIVMTGQMDYWPNLQGAEWFAKQVFPQVAAEMPQARFYVVGANPPPDFLKKMAGVTVTGRVPDVRPYLAVWVEDDPLLFARATIETLKNSELRNLGPSGRTYVEQHHNWDRLMSCFEALFNASNADIASEPQRPAPITFSARLAARV
ncbi:MAG: TIGR03087 family PEP-CTERM/XrtA system glycosyltransferase [Alphaproteobacteria bacterium]|nr:TIGR03087 family PEP-CTERM/XrtA system glycosyltransferase [Alphaproteobacteria bacterium]